MVQRILSLLNKQLGVNEAAFVLGGFALISQLLGLLRDRALAARLGPSLDLDIYYAAFRIPDFLYISIASLASITILLPFLLARVKDGQQQPDFEKAKVFFSSVFTIFVSAITVVSIVLALLMPLIAPLIAPGFDAEALAKLVSVSRIMLISPILLGASNILGSVTHLFNKFFVYAVAPVFYNLGILIGVFMFLPRFGIEGLALGVILGGFLHLVIQLPVINRHHFFPKLIFRVNWKEILEVIRLSLPRTLALSVHQLSIFVLIAITSSIGAGAISMFNLSYNLQSAPIGIIGISYSVASFPTLVRFFTNNERGLFVRHIIEASKKIIFWSLPVVFLFIVLRAQIVRVILGAGSFSWNNTRITAAALALFSLSLVAQSLVHLFVRGYYAAGNTKKPLLINLVSALVIICSAFGLLHLFSNNEVFRYFIESLLRVNGLPDTKVLMLPLAYSIGMIGNFFFLWLLFYRDFCRDSAVSLSKAFFQSFASAFFMGFVAYKFLDVFDTIFNIETFWGIFLQGLCSGMLGILAGVIILILFENEEFRQITKTLKSKFSNVPVIAPEQQEL